MSLWSHEHKLRRKSGVQTGVPSEHPRPNKMTPFLCTAVTFQWFCWILLGFRLHRISCLCKAKIDGWVELILLGSRAPRRLGLINNPYELIHLIHGICHIYLIGRVWNLRVRISDRILPDGGWPFCGNSGYLILAILVGTQFTELGSLPLGCDSLKPLIDWR